MRCTRIHLLRLCHVIGWCGQMGRLADMLSVSTKKLLLFPIHLLLIGAYCQKLIELCCHFCISRQQTVSCNQDCACQTPWATMKDLLLPCGNNAWQRLYWYSLPLRFNYPCLQGVPFSFFQIVTSQFFLLSLLQYFPQLLFVAALRIHTKDYPLRVKIRNFNFFKLL